jgi:hypothetical protein
MSVDRMSIEVPHNAELRNEPSRTRLFAWRLLCGAFHMDEPAALVQDGAAVSTEGRRQSSMAATFWRNFVNRCRERRHQGVTEHLTPLEVRKRLVTPARNSR